MCDVGAGCSGTWANMRKMAHCGNLSVVNVTWPANSTRSHNLKLEDTRPFRGTMQWVIVILVGYAIYLERSTNLELCSLNRPRSNI